MLISYIYKIMRKKHFILFSLFMAYMLMLAHLVVPHHHHSNKQEADVRHNHEHNHHQHNGEDSKGHGHTAHFVHLPDSDNYLASSFFKKVQIQELSLDLFFIVPAEQNLSVHSFITALGWPPGLPPPYNSISSPIFWLRGPPVYIS